MSDFEERLNALQTQIDSAAFELAELRKLDLREKVIQRYAAISTRAQHSNQLKGKASTRSTAPPASPKPAMPRRDVPFVATPQDATPRAKPTSS